MIANYYKYIKFKREYTKNAKSTGLFSNKRNLTEQKYRIYKAIKK